MQSHVTRILDASREARQSSSGPYVAVCLCPWRSAAMPSREGALRAAQIHRLNARVQEENP